MEDTNLVAETAKINAEAAKIQRERWFYPYTIVIAAVVAGIALAKTLL